MKTIAVLGSTGSIGCQTLDVVRAHPENLKIATLAAGKNSLNLLVKQINEFKPELVAVPDTASATELQELIKQASHQPAITYGQEGLIAAATYDSLDLVMVAVVGFLGLAPVEAALKKGKNIALANKETLVVAGNYIMSLAVKHQARIIPVDSEHSAIFQCLDGHSKNIDRIILTGSGGPFRTWSQEQINQATPAEALRHPNWSMGPKITIDSATLMNKGLEIIEARWLFNLDPKHIKIVIHPQSILHSAVEFVDGSVIGQMGLPDMRLPIHYALFYPQRMPSPVVPRLDLSSIKNLTFEEPDWERFPCLKLAYQVAGEDNTLPCALNAANEIAVGAFLKGSIKFPDIAATIEQVLSTHQAVANPSLEDILEADFSAREAATRLIDKHPIKIGA